MRKKSAPTKPPVNFVKAWRLHRKMTGDQLAQAVGSDKSQISRLEKGGRRLALAWIEKLSAALDISPSDLLRDPVDALAAPKLPAGASKLSDLVGLDRDGLEPYEVGDDAMTPTFAPGDRVIVDTTDRKLAAGVYLVDYGFGPAVRRLSPKLKSVTIAADNPLYGGIDAPASSLKIIGRVLARVSRV